MHLAFNIHSVLLCPAPPKFDKSLADIKVIEGESARLEAIADGIPFPEVIWSRDGALLHKREDILFDKKEGLISCTFKSAKSTDSGSYTLKCTNDSGIAESQAKLTVNGELYFCIIDLCRHGITQTIVEKGCSFFYLIN